MPSRDKACTPVVRKRAAKSLAAIEESSGSSRALRAHKYDGVREALDALYGKELSCMDEALVRMQQASLCKEAW